MKFEEVQISKFIESFKNNPGQRTILIEDLITNSNRLLLNIPKYGIARKISNQLFDESFSLFVEFENILSLILHPFFLRINFNLITQTIINNRFDEKYQLYRRDVSRIIRRNEYVNLELFRNVIIEMVRDNGHYMAIKFYDIIIRKRYKKLYRIAKPIEVTAFNMKRRLTDNDEKNLERIRKLYFKHIEKYGDLQGTYLISRMEWDDVLKKYIPYLQDKQQKTGMEYEYVNQTSQNIEQENIQSEGPVNEIINSNTTRHTQYAKLLKEKFLDNLDDTDEDGIIKILEQINSKNQTKSPGDNTDELANKIVSIWLEDDTISEEKKNTLKRLLRDHIENIDRGPFIISPEQTDISGMEDIDAEIITLSNNDLRAVPFVEKNTSEITKKNFEIVDANTTNDTLIELTNEDLVAIDTNAANSAHIPVSDHSPSEPDSNIRNAHPPSNITDSGNRMTNISDELTNEEFKHTFQDLYQSDKTFEINEIPAAKLSEAAKYFDSTLKNQNHIQSTELEKLVENPDAPPETKEILGKILRANGFEKAYNSITKSIEFSPKVKIILLEQWLKKHGEEQGWFEENRETKFGRIDRIVQYYMNFINLSDKSESGIKSKHIDVKDTDADAHSQKNVKSEKQNDENGSQKSDITREEKAFNQVETILKAFADNIDVLEPIIPFLQQLLAPSYQQVFIEQVRSAKNRAEEVITKTIACIDNKLPDPELIETIQHSQPLFQYLWQSRIMKHYNGKTFEIIFKPFEDNTDFYNAIIRLSKIISINNEHDILEKTRKKESELIENIQKNFSQEELKLLWLQTSSRQRKDKVRLFRDLLGTTGDITIKSSTTDVPSDEKRIKPSRNIEDPDVTHMVDTLEKFLRYNKIPRFQRLAMKQVPEINKFLDNLSGGEDNAVSLVKNHKQEFIDFLKYIINDPSLKDAIKTPQAIQYCKAHNLL